MFLFIISMSGAAALSAARRRRTKNVEPPKTQNTPNINNIQASNMEDKPFVPVVSIKESIYLLNNKLGMLQQNIMILNNKISTNNNDAIEALSTKLNDNVIATQVKINILEKELAFTKEKLDDANTTISMMEKKINSFEEEQLVQKSFLNKMQSLVLYTEDDKNMSDDDDEINTISDTCTDELKIVATNFNTPNITEIELNN